jgi:hypothetical protein
MGSPEQPQPMTPTAFDATTTGVPDDANDLRGYHFKRLMAKTLTVVLLGSLTLIAFVVGGFGVNPLIGLLAAAGVFLLGLLVVLVIADNRAASDFFEVYAAKRGLSLIHGRGRLPQATPLLRKGDDRYTERTLSGPIAEGFAGTLALFTYEEESRDADGNTQTNYYRYTLGLVEVPDCVAFVPELYCQRKFGLRALEKFEDAFRGNKERVTLESEKLLGKYEIFATKEQDAVWLRRLFSPSFIVWLADSTPDKFAFELVGGTLCCYVNGHKEKTADLDALAAATGAVARRLREEAGEASPPAAQS